MYHNVPYLLIARICSVFLFVLCVILKVLGTIKLSLFNFGYSLSARKREKRAAAHLWYSVGILGAIIVFVFNFFGVISSFLHVHILNGKSSKMYKCKCFSCYIVAVTEKYLLGQRTRTFSWSCSGNPLGTLLFQNQKIYLNSNLLRQIRHFQSYISILHGGGSLLFTFSITLYFKQCIKVLFPCISMENTYTMPKKNFLPESCMLNPLQLLKPIKNRLNFSNAHIKQSKNQK